MVLSILGEARVASTAAGTSYAAAAAVKTLSAAARLRRRTTYRINKSSAVNIQQDSSVVPTAKPTLSGRLSPNKSPPGASTPLPRDPLVSVQFAWQTGLVTVCFIDALEDICCPPAAPVRLATDREVVAERERVRVADAPRDVEKLRRELDALAEDVEVAVMLADIVGVAVSDAELEADGDADSDAKGSEVSETEEDTSALDEGGVCEGVKRNIVEASALAVFELVRELDELSGREVPRLIDGTGDEKLDANGDPLGGGIEVACVTLLEYVGDIDELPLALIEDPILSNCEGVGHAEKVEDRATEGDIEALLEGVGEAMVKALEDPDAELVGVGEKAV